MSYDALVISAHPDDAESQMGGTLAKLSEKGQRVLLVDLTDGEPTEFAERGVRAQQADKAARILGVKRLSLGLQDRFLTDTIETRLQIARLLREHRPLLHRPWLELRSVLPGGARRGSICNPAQLPRDSLVPGQPQSCRRCQQRIGRCFRDAVFRLVSIEQTARAFFLFQ